MPANNMMTPRSYQFSSGSRGRSQSPLNRKPLVPSQSKSKGKQQMGGASGKGDTEGRTGGNVHIPAKPKRISSISHSTPSNPVVIPTKTSTSKARHGTVSVSPKSELHDQHDPDAMSPSMAALMAVTSVPRTSARAIKGDHRRRLMHDSFRRSVSSTSPQSWNVLLSPPSPTDINNEHEKEGEGDLDVGSLTSQSTLADRLAMYRSLSSDSIPSLDIGDDVFTSPDSPPMPRTPSSRRARSPRREKLKHASPPEPLAVGETHPLARQHNEPAEVSPVEDPGSAGSPQTNLDVSQTRKLSGTLRATIKLKSNLTASLQKLKSAAKSITAPTPSVSSVLAINSKFVVDSRPDPPRPKSPLPFNNSAFSVETLSNLDRDNSQHPLAQQLYFSSTPPEEYRPISSSIQLQHYVRRAPDENPLLDRATAPPIFAQSSPPPPILLPGIDSPRPREPRENSDFLRVVVLEMNMRRAGKLGDVIGRARIWVGPRPEKVKSTGEAVESAAKEMVAMTRAEKGMGEEVVVELAEAMHDDDRTEASGAKKLSTRETMKNGPFEKVVPARWTSWAAE